MTKRENALAKIVSAITGIHEDLLLLFPNLKSLINSADESSSDQKLYYHGIIVFGWPTAGKPVLTVYSYKPEKVAKLEVTFSAEGKLPANSFLQFSLENVWSDEEEVEKIPANKLTARNIEVLLLVARGMTNGQIAAKLNISLSVVKAQIAEVMDKLNFKRRNEAAMWAIEHFRSQNTNNHSSLD